MEKDQSDTRLRQITSHQVNPANNELKVSVLDAPGAGGACHLYHIHGFNTETNPSCPFVGRYGEPAQHSTVLFQNGPINEVGVNGVTHEVLLAILIDRLECFQAGDYACDENQRALYSLLEAQAHLKSRTVGRIARGVEGTHEK